MDWREILKEKQTKIEPKWIDFSNPIQYPKEKIASSLRKDITESKINVAVNRFVPLLEEYAYKDKSRASRYKKIAQSLRDLSLEIKNMVTEYE